ncbi:MAG: hypothetical protein APF84_14840 [Gracilibacter sp. BRH_c7a]|nr:MAG: hypothetical protein APF84_14840 [Gracilibacter sp. BRH_c7a]
MNDNENKKTIVFPKGIPGFEDHTTFILEKEEDSPIVHLESAKDKEVGFVLFPPQLYFKNYLSKIEFGSEEVEALEITAEDTVEIWAIITLCLSDISKSTVNLRAPIVINPRTNQGFQFILNDENYSSRQQLFVDGQQEDKDRSNEEGAVG